MKDSAKRIALAALFAALVSGGKLALMFIPNVEVVSILLAVAGYCFGALFSLSVSLVFCTVETALWGFNTWVILYFVYWPLVSLLFGLIGKSRLKNRWVTAGLAAAMTFFFGVLSSVIDTLIAFGGGGFVFNGEDFFLRFGILYARGIVFFAVHIVSNFILFALLFRALCELVNKLKIKMFPEESL